jgi:outer membrane lipoprotein carrier protein
MRLLALALVLLLPVPVTAQSGAASPSPESIARDIQQRYERIRDFSANFEHVYEGGLLRKKAVEKGSVLVKKPGKMRWTYTAPERKEFVSDGRKLYSYIPQDKQVIVSDVPPADEASSPALFLAGKGNVLRDFTVTAADVPHGADEWAIKLVPRRQQQEYDWLILVVARGSLVLHRLVTADAQGGTSTFTFSKLRENVGLPDSSFTFTIPRGVDVITDGSRAR